MQQWPLGTIAVLAGMLLMLLLFLHQRPGRAFSYATTGVDMLVATMITYASGGYTSPFAVLFFLVITVSVVVANLLADALYSKLDPRIGSRGR